MGKSKARSRRSRRIAAFIQAASTMITAAAALIEAIKH
jgi:hypothetical protein